MSLQEERLFCGWTELFVDKHSIDALYREQRLELPGHSFFPNQFAVLRDAGGSSQSAIARYSSKEHALVPLRYAGLKPWDIEPLNAGQRMFLELLMEPSIQLVACPSKAGTGKNILSFAAGLHQVEQGLYDKMVVYKPLIPVGQDVGYLPGELDEKLSPHHASSYDALAFILGRNLPKGVESRIRSLIDAGVVELSAFTFIRGTSLPRQFIVIDEAQNISIPVIKAALTRAGEGTKVVLLGHPGQIDEAAQVTYDSCALVHVVRRFLGQPIFGCVTLTQCVRSELARLADELL